MGRHSDGWGNCVECGEVLKPEDAERLGWSDRCEMCLTRAKLYHLILDREYTARDTLKQVTTDEWRKENGDTAEEYWTKRLETYREMYEPLKEMRRLKQSLQDESY